MTDRYTFQYNVHHIYIYIIFYFNIHAFLNQTLLRKWKYQAIVTQYALIPSLFFRESMNHLVAIYFSKHSPPGLVWIEFSIDMVIQDTKTEYSKHNSSKCVFMFSRYFAWLTFYGRCYSIQTCYLFCYIIIAMMRHIVQFTWNDMFFKYIHTQWSLYRHYIHQDVPYMCTRTKSCLINLVSNSF